MKLRVVLVLAAVLAIVAITALPVYAQGSKVYVVRWGDTLYSIARRHGTTVRAIMWANGLTSTRIYAGQRLLIPAPEASCPGAPPQRVRVGERARVCTAYERVMVRAQPRRNSAVLTRLRPGRHVSVVDGPVCANAFSWWAIRTDSGTVGWVAEGGDEIDPYYLCPQASCPGAPPQRVRVGESARVCTAYERVMVRAQPRRNSAVLTRVGSGRYVSVIDGPVCANAFSWWLVRTDSGTIGWVAEGGDEIDPYYLCPRSAAEPAVTISPLSGPRGTLVQVVASGFPPYTLVTVGVGPENSEFWEVARGTTDANGVFTVQVPAQLGPGTNLIFAAAAEGQPGVSCPELFHITDAAGA